jgi:hypothetical protein
LQFARATGIRRAFVRPTALLLAVAAAVAMVLAATGQMRPWITPDTSGWLDPCAPFGCWAGPRGPVYGWLATAVPTVVLPWLQYAALVAAASWLMRGVRRVGGSGRVALAVGVAVVASNMTVLWAHAVVPELFAHAAMLAAVGGVLHLVAGRGRGLPVAIGALAGLAYLLKPALLSMAVLLPVLVLALAPRRRVVAAGLFAACLLPFVLVSGWRLATVGDFNIVSFGGFQMSGMAALMLTPEIAQTLPADLQPTAEAILARREALVAAHLALPIPLNSQSQRSFVSAATGYFDVLARTHDDVLYGAVAPARRADESWVAFNARMQRLALTTLAAAPREYAAWVFGATTRLAGRSVVANLPFVLGCVAWLCLSRRRRFVPALPQDVRLLGWLTAFWTLGAGLPAVLLTFPAARYIDSACLLLAAWPIYAALRRLGITIL